MKNKKKTIIILVISIICVFFITLNAYTIYKHKVIESINEKNNSMAIMLDDGTGNYVESSETSFPTSGYAYNATKSYCLNGSTLTWDSTNHKVTMTTDHADKCYVYFDLPSHDIKVVASTDGTNNLAKGRTDGGYSVATSCSSATGTWSNKYWSLDITGVSVAQNAACTLTYTTKTNKDYLNAKITSLAGSTTGTGQVVNENGYRYEGKDPNNWIWFNNEMWRIIGVFSTTLSDGSTTQNLTKIIREDSLGGMAFDKSNVNDYNSASLKTLLNNYYYTKTDGTSSGYCYWYSTTVPGNCNYGSDGIDASYRTMVKNVKWNLGGYTSADTAANTYTAERGTTVYSGHATSTTGYIGLMYPSDLGYSVLASSCARTTQLGSYGTSACSGSTWMGKGLEWTISPYSSSPGNEWFWSNGGNLYYSIASNGYGVRPVLYLDSTTYVIEGTGTNADPYIIGM
jgi:hypothetical protein